MKRRWPEDVPTSADERYKLVYEIAFRVAYRMSKNRSTAEDLAQDTWIAVDRWLQKYEQTEGGEELRDFKRWVARVATNKTINAYKSKWQQVIRSTDNDKSDELRARERRPDEICELKEIGAQIQDAMGQLTQPLNQAFVLYYKGHSYEEIAGILECPIGTIKTRIHRARNTLAGLLHHVS